MAKTVVANGKTFTFDDDATNEQIGDAIDEYFSGQAEPLKKKEDTGTFANEPSAPSPIPVQKPSESYGLSSLGEAKPNVPAGERGVIEPKRKPIDTGDIDFSTEEGIAPKPQPFTGEQKKTLKSFAFNINEAKRKAVEEPLAPLPLSKEQMFQQVGLFEKRVNAVDSLASGQEKIAVKTKGELDELTKSLQDIQSNINQLSQQGRAQEAQQLAEQSKPLINEYKQKARELTGQVAKLNYYSKRKEETQKEMVDISESQKGITNQWDALNVGLNNLTANTLRTPQFIYNTLIGLQNKVAKETGLPIEAPYQEDGYLINAAKYFEKNAEAYNKVIEKKKQQTDYSIADLFSQGKVSEALNLLGEGIFESAPSTAAIALGSAAGAGRLGIVLGGGAVFGTGNFQENQKKGMDIQTNLTNSWINGVVEGIFEELGTVELLKYGKELFTNGGKKAAEEGAKSIWNKVYGKTAKKLFPVTSSLIEGVSEGETSFVQNYVNMVMGTNEDYNKEYAKIQASDLDEESKKDALYAISKKYLFNGVADAFYTGAGMGGLMSIFIKKQYPPVDEKSRKDLNDAKKRFNEYSSTLTNPNVPQDAKEVIQQKATEEAEKIVNIQEQEDNRLKKSLSKDDYESIIDIQSKIDNLEQSIDAIDNEQSKAIVYQQVAELNKEKADILKREIKQEDEIGNTDNNIPNQVESPQQEINITPIEVIAGEEQDNADGGVAEVVQGDGQGVEARIQEIESLLSSDNASMQKTGSGNLIKDAREELISELAELKKKTPTVAVVQPQSKLDAKKADYTKRIERKLVNASEEKNPIKKALILYDALNSATRVDTGQKENVQQLLNEHLAESGLKIENVEIGAKYDDTNTSLDATIAGEGTENLKVVEVLSPIIRNANGVIVKQAKVIVESSDNKPNLPQEKAVGENVEVVTPKENEALRDVESTAKALDDIYWEDKKIGKQNQLDLLSLIPKKQIDNPNTNGFYRVSKMDDDWVSKQPKEVQENINRLNEAFKDSHKEEIISEAYHKAKADGSNPELVSAVESLLSKEQTPVFDDKNKTNEEGQVPKLLKVKSFKTDEGNFDIYDIEKGGARGRGDMFTILKDKSGWIVRNAFVPDNLQKKGIATDFYKKMNEASIKATGNPLRSTQQRTLSNGEVVHELTPNAIKLWDSLVRDGFAEKLGNKNYRFFTEQTPKTKEEAPALRDVESTAKALESIDGKAFNDIAKKAKKTLEWSAKDLVGNRTEINNEKDYVDRALEDGRYSNLFPTKQGQSAYAKSMWKAELENRKFESKKLSEAYHKAKSDGSNPELVKAVESLLSKEQAPAKEETKLTPKTKENAVQKSSTEEEVPRNGEGGENKPQGSEGVGQGKQGKEAAEKEEVRLTPSQQLVSDATDLLYQVNDKTKTAQEKRILKEKMNDVLKKNPRIKYIFDNIKQINSLLGEELTKKGDCPP